MTHIHLQAQPALPRSAGLFDRLGPRPRMTLIICEGQVAEIWINGRAPLITLRDYDCRPHDLAPCRDRDGFAYTRIDWRAPAWRLGLSLSKGSHHPIKQPPQAGPRLSSMKAPHGPAC